jgi:hypothetical protein
VQRFVAQGLAYYRMNLAEALRPGSSGACHRNSDTTLSADSKAYSMAGIIVGIQASGSISSG